MLILIQMFVQQAFQVGRLLRPDYLLFLLVLVNVQTTAIQIQKFSMVLLHANTLIRCYRVHITEVTILNRVFSLSEQGKLKGSVLQLFCFLALLSLLVHGIGTKLLLNWEQNMLCQKLANFMQKKDIYVNRFESVILACEFVGNRPEHNSKRVPYGIEF